MALKDRPLLSRSRWTTENLLITVVWLAVCVGGAIAAVRLTDGIWEWLGLGLAALFASPLVEAPFSLGRRHYEDYRQEWEEANVAPPKE